MKKTSVVWLVLIQFVIAFEWLHATWGKWTTSGFMENISGTLTGFSKSTQYDFYNNFLKSIAIPNAELFGQAIRIGELLVGICLVVGGVILISQRKINAVFLWILVIALFGGALMNLNFFLAAGSTSPSTWGINIVMGLMEVILAIHYIFNREELSSYE